MNLTTEFIVLAEVEQILIIGGNTGGADGEVRSPFVDDPELLELNFDSVER